MSCSVTGIQLAGGDSNISDVYSCFLEHLRCTRALYISRTCFSHPTHTFTTVIATHHNAKCVPITDKTYKYLYPVIEHIRVYSIFC